MICQMRKVGYSPNSHPANPVDRDVFSNWEKEYWKYQAETEMRKGGYLVNKSIFMKTELIEN